MLQAVKSSNPSTSTRQHTNIRLDPITDARLSWIKAFYQTQGEALSLSVIVRRSIALLENHLGQLSDTQDPTELKLELMQVLSATQNKPDKYAGEYPWENLNDPLKPFPDYYLR